MTEHTERGGRLHRPLATLSRLRRWGDVPVVVMLAWAGWLAVPWSFSGLAQARAAAAAAAADAEPPRAAAYAHEAPPAGPARPSVERERRPAAWSLPAAPAAALTTVRPTCDDRPFSGPASANALFPAGPAACGLDARGLDARGLDARGLDARGLRGAAPTPAGLDGNVDAVAVERARIAGEVHDAAGHGLAAIAMQAGLALVALDDDPDQVRASLRAIRETSTTALAQLRAALDGIDPPGGDLGSLIDGVRAAGLPVDVEPAALAVPAHLQGTVYRVVRESLTNVLRHAGPTRALVRASDDAGEFVLEVADRGPGRGSTGPGSTGPGGPGSTGSSSTGPHSTGPHSTGLNEAGDGRGIAGMRARVVEAGGRFSAGPREGGGFQVIARFPQVAT
ncbi:sensor histidine kinase [Nonomuraea sp. H19]|uniref:sensor histidine kinase n=1 Tax=Nonomuraea sp. H19 TaxID=3452206 RepID=UPI003F897134